MSGKSLVLYLTKGNEFSSKSPKTKKTPLKSNHQKNALLSCDSNRPSSPMPQSFVIKTLMEFPDEMLKRMINLVVACVFLLSAIIFLFLLFGNKILEKVCRPTSDDAHTPHKPTPFGVPSSSHASATTAMTTTAIEAIVSVVVVTM